MENKKKYCDYLIKVIVVGDSGVGKSSILLRYADDAFSEKFISTIGVDFKVKNLTVDKKQIKLQIWDTAGQERFRTIVSAYYKNIDCVFVIFDLTDVNSFDNIKLWLNDI